MFTIDLRTGYRPPKAKRYFALMLMTVFLHAAAGVCVGVAIGWSAHKVADTARVGLFVTAVVLLALAQAIYALVDIARASARTAMATETIAERLVTDQ